MKKQRKKYVIDSVFMRTLIILLALFLFLLLAFWGTLNQVMRSNYERKVESASEQVLKQTSEMTELALQLIVDDLDQLIWEDTILSYLIAPQSHSSQSEYEILLHLNNLKESSNLVDTVWLYDPEADWVLSSDGFIGASGDYQYHTAIEQYVPSQEASDRQGQEREHLVYLSDSQPYCVADLILTKHIGSLFIAIDFDQLYEMINVEQVGSSIYYMDHQGNILAPDEMDKEVIELSGKLEELEFGSIDGQRGRWCYRYNPNMDWFFLQKLDSITTTAVFNEYISVLIPGTLLFLVLGIWGVYIVTRRIYEPINQLVRLVLMHGDGGALQKKNELSYLELSFMRTMDEKKTLQDSMKFWEKDIMEQVFRKLLQGSALEDTGIDMLNKEVKASWEQGTQYQVIVCQKEHDAKVTTVADLDIQLFTQSLEKIVKGDKNIFQSFAVPMANDLVAIILTDSEKSAFQLKKTVSKLEEDIMIAFKSSAFSVSVAHGRAYAHLEDIVYSWQEGLQQIRYAKYLEKSPEEIKHQKANEEESDAERTYYFEERARQILDHLLKEQQKQAEELLDRIIVEVAESSDSAELKKKYFETIQGIFLEKRQMVIGQDDEENEANPSAIDEEDLQAYMSGSLKAQMDQILRGTRKNSYRYVESALRYIQENCSDSELSSQMVAEYLHINTSYFSEIFNKQMQESFTSYLNRIRINNAMELLITTKLPAYDIGFKCGFTTVQHFNRTFKKYTGMTPKQYRDSENG